MAVAAGDEFTVLITSGGRALAFGNRWARQCEIPYALQDDPFVVVTAGGFHTVLITSNGRALAFGSNHVGQCNLPPAPSGELFMP